MDSTQTVCFDRKRIETTVTNRASTISSWISNVRSSYPSSMELIVGLDCEWRPNSRRGMNNQTATLQLCVGKKCIIIQLVYLDSIPRVLRDFLRDRNMIFVGVEVERDAAKIHREYGLNCRRVVDVRDMAMVEYWFEKKTPGLKDVAFAVVGLDVPKSMDVCLSDWQVRVLDELQVQYACIDAYASYRIGLKLLKGI